MKKVTVTVILDGDDAPEMFTFEVSKQEYLDEVKSERSFRDLMSFKGCKSANNPDMYIYNITVVEHD